MTMEAALPTSQTQLRLVLPRLVAYLLQRPPRPRRIPAQRQQPRNLTRPARNRPQHRQQPDRTTLIQSDQSSRRQIPLRRIADRPHHGKRQPMLIRHPSHSTAFQIDRLRPRRREQRALGLRIRGNRIPRQQAMPGHTPKPSRQRSIGRKTPSTNNHRVRDNNHPRPQRRIKPARQPEAHQRCRAIPHQPQSSLRRPGRRPATNGNRTTEAGGNPRLRRKAHHKAKLYQNPNSTRCELPRRRLRYRASASSGKYSR
jgi:hypothetical protein